MKHRISVGVFIVKQNKILLVNHRKHGHYDFWVAPGGGVIDSEDIESAAKREVKEESGLTVDVLKLAYIEELYSPHKRICKFWFFTDSCFGELQTEHESAIREHIVDVCFVSRDKLVTGKVFPPEIIDRLWIDIKNGFPNPQYIGLRKMDLY